MRMKCRIFITCERLSPCFRHAFVSGMISFIIVYKLSIATKNCHISTKKIFSEVSHFKISLLKNPTFHTHQPDTYHCVIDIQNDVIPHSIMSSMEITGSQADRVIDSQSYFEIK